MEFKIIAPTENQYLKAIEFNKEELKKYLSVQLEKYQGLSYTDEQIKEAKNDRANLNAFRVVIETKRKEVKAKCLAPYETFEKDVKEILAILDAPLLAIDEQIKNFEQKEDEKKIEVIHEMYKTLIDGKISSKLLTFEKLWQDKWLNKSVRLNAVRDELDSKITAFVNDLEVINDLQTEFSDAVKDKYIQTLDLATALAENKRLIAQKASLEEIKKNKSDQKQEPQQPILTAQKEQVYRTTMTIRATLTQIETLKKYLKANNIEIVVDKKGDTENGK
jgi:Protein of unknown function (DUF1351).